MDPWIERLVFFLLGVLATATGGGYTFGRTLARHDVRLEHLERAVAHVVQLIENAKE